MTKLICGLFSVILNDIEKRDKETPDKIRLTLYARTIVGLFPGSVGLEYVREFQRMAPEGRKKLYEPLIRAIEANKKPTIQRHEGEIRDSHLFSRQAGFDGADFC